MLTKLRQPMHVRQRIANVTTPPTVLVIVANAAQVMMGTHTSLMVAKVMIYTHFVSFFSLFFFFFSHLAELTGLDFHLHNYIYIYMTSWLYCYCMHCVSDIDECEKNPNPCNKTCENINITGSFCNKICVNIAGSYECSCPKGYEGDDGRTNGTGCRPKFSQFRRIAIELGKYIYI